MPTRRATIADVARVAGVSVATVDRVLNQRRPVRRETAAVVVEAAESLDYYATALLRRNAETRHAGCRLGFLLQKRDKPFYVALAAALETAAQEFPSAQIQTVIRYLDELSPRTAAERLRELGPSVDALGAVLMNHPLVTDEIARLQEAGIPTVSLLSTVSAAGIAGHVGIDARKAGRTAGWGMSRCLRADGPIGVLIGSNRYAGHEDRETGFRTYFREHRPDLAITDTLAFLDDDEGAHAATLEMLGRRPELAGLFVIGGGVEGAVRALREEGRAGAISVVGSELNEFTRRALLEGEVDMIVGTPVDRLAQGAVRMMTRCARDAQASQGTLTVPLDLYISENA